jgi:hypothetical protein
MLARRIDQVIQNIAHELVDRSISRRRRPEDFPRALNVRSRHQLVPTALHNRECPVRRHLEMELQPNDVSLQLKRLILASKAPCEPDRTSRKIKRFTVPMEYGAFRRKAKRPLDLMQSLNRKPSDFLNRVRIHPRLQGARNKLSSEANAQDPKISRHRFTYCLLLELEPAEIGFVINTHRATHDDQQFDRAEVWQRIPFKEPGVTNVGTPRSQPRLDAPEPLELNVLQNVNFQFLAS